MNCTVTGRTVNLKPRRNARLSVRDKVEHAGLIWEVTTLERLPNSEMTRVVLSRGCGADAKSKTFKLPRSKLFTARK